MLPSPSARSFPVSQNYFYKFYILRKHGQAILHKIKCKQTKHGGSFMSDLTATNCGCGCEGTTTNNSCNIIWTLLLLSCLCGNGGGCGGWGNGCGNGCGNGFGNDSCTWIILLLLFCGNGFGCGNNCGNGCGC